MREGQKRKRSLGGVGGRCGGVEVEVANKKWWRVLLGGSFFFPGLCPVLLGILAMIHDT